jgi:hypothetical protein
MWKVIITVSLIAVSLPVAAQTVPDVQPGSIPFVKLKELAYNSPLLPIGKEPDLSALSTQEWKKVERCIDLGLSWLRSQQLANGSFPTPDCGEPAITSLVIMAFLSRGHSPGEGEYGEMLNRAIDYVLSQQQDDGLLYSGYIPPSYEFKTGSATATYNHAIAGLMLGEVYGMTSGARNKKIKLAIEKALACAWKLQYRHSPFEKDKHGLRYYRYLNIPNKGEADLSVTAWYIMFYRSAKNANFDVPEEHVQEAVKFVRECYDEKDEWFMYGPYPVDKYMTRAMVGAGILSLIISGNATNDEKMIQHAGRFINVFPFDQYAKPVKAYWHYSIYYCSQATFMMGGEYWRIFYPVAAKTLCENQSPEGFWEVDKRTAYFGNSYSTALAILTLTPPYQMLPIYQR